MIRRFLPLLVVLPLFARADDTQGLVMPLKQVSMSSPVLQEVIEHVLVDEGDAVKEGQLLIELRKEKEEMEVKQAQQVVEQKNFTAEGAKKLFKEKIGSQEAAMEKQTESELATIQLSQAQVRLKEKTIRPP